MININVSSKAIIISPLDVSKRINFRAPSFKALTTCFDLPIKDVIYAETLSVKSVDILDFIGSPEVSQIITPRTPSFSSNRRIIFCTSFTSINVRYLLRFNDILKKIYS